LPYDTLADLVPIVQVANVPNVLVVPKTLPLKTIDEFVAYLKAHPGELNYGSTGVGTAGHLTAVMLLKQSGSSATHVPYSSSNVITDLTAGRIDFMLATIPSVIQLVRNGKLRALAVTSEKRSNSLPDIPTLSESGFPGFQAGAWLGFFSPKGTPDKVVRKLNENVNLVLPDMEAQMRAAGAELVGGAPEEFKAFVHSEFVKWRAIVQESGASAQ
jgi:tripartite-type tricarboxylate transporter receptor subunit TctC